MPLDGESRARLAARQAALVTALVAQGEPSEGIDPLRFRGLAASLARKRVRSAARAWSGLARALGADFPEKFAVYAAAMPLPRDGGPLADGRAFARWLAARGELPDVGRSQALTVDIRYRRTPNGLVPRRGSACKIAWLRGSRRLMIGIHLPWLGGKSAGTFYIAAHLGNRTNARPNRHGPEDMTIVKP